MKILTGYLNIWQKYRTLSTKNLVYIEQEVDIEDVTKGETFEGPSYEDFTQKDSDENLDFKPLYAGAAITV